MGGNFLDTSKLVEKLNTILDEHARHLDLVAEANKGVSNSQKVPSEYIKRLKTLEELLDKISQSNTALTKTEKKLARERKQRESQIKKESDLRQRLLRQREKEERQSKIEVALQLKLASAYNQLNAKLIKAEKEYRDLAASQGLSNKQTKIAQREVLKLRARMDGINKPIKRWNANVGNYASGLQNIAGALGWAGVTYAIINGLKSTYETIKVYDALIKSLDKVTDSQQAASSEFAYIIDISERFGLSLRQTTKDYVSFLAAVKGTNLEGSKARKIFSSVSKAASSMGLSAEETSGTLRALNQIISKGKVQAEELRGQLGDRIPGAFQIMARAIGVTTAQLDDMLKKGEVIADEVLPKFAAEMEKAFGVENVNRIDTLVAAQNRLSTSWDKFILGIENGDGVISKFIKGTFNALSRDLNAFTTLLGGLNGAMKEQETKSFTSFSDKLAEANTKNKDSIKALEILLESRSKVLRKAEKEAKNFEPFAVTDTAKKELKRLKLIEASERGITNAIKSRIESLKNEKNSLIDKIILIDKSLKQGDLEIKSLKHLRDLYAKLSQAKIRVGGEFKRAKEVAIELNFKESLSLKDVIKAYKEVQSTMAKTSQGYKDIQDSIDALNGLMKTESLLLDDSYNKKINDAEASEKQRLELLKLQKATDDFISSIANSTLGELGLGSLTTFFDGTFDNLLKGADTLEEKFAVTFNAIAEVSKEAFSIINSVGQENFNQQYVRLEQQRDIATQFAGESASAKAEIDRQYEQKRAKIQRRQAEAQKKQALFNIITSTAQGVVSALASTPPNVPLSIAIVLIGATKAAIVQGQQIPEFKDGVRGFGGGLAVVGDGGKHEYIKTPDGTISRTPNTDTLVNLPKGSDVYKDDNDFISSLYKELALNDIMPFSNSLGRSIIPNISNNGISKEELREVFSNELSKLDNTIKNKKETTLNIDENGINAFSYKNGQKRKMLNSRVRGSSINV